MASTDRPHGADPADASVLGTPDGSWQYRLQLISVRGCQTGPDGMDEQMVALRDQGWQLVSRKTDGDGQTEQRVFRRPA